VVGWLAERGWDGSVLKTLAANVIGTAIIFGLGFAWLTGFLMSVKGIGLDAGAAAALANGVTPFLIGAAAKIALAAAVLPLARKMVDRR
jgi:biotin transport system substrate-specific component